MLGVTLVVLAVVTLLSTGLIAVADLHTWWLLLPAVLALLVIGTAWAWVARANPAVTFTDDGYVVKGFRGTGERAARWSDVEDAVTTYRGDLPCVQVRLKNGNATTIPVTLLAADREAFVRDLQHHLQAGQGYRKL